MSSDTSAKRQSLPRDAEGHLSPRAEQLNSPILQFNLHQEIEALRREPGYASSGRVAKQIAKHENLRSTLVVIRSGAHIAEHAAPDEAAIHVIEGRVRMQLPGQVAELGVGNLLVLGKDVKHDVKADVDSAFWATIAVAAGK